MLCAPLVAQGPENAPDQDAENTIHAKRDALDRAAPMLLARYDVPSVGVAYIENGEIAFVRHYGFQTWGYPANEETLYNVASLTKPVTAEVILRLADAGMFSLDAPLTLHHVDDDMESDPRAQLLTAKLVMRHRTGLPNWRYETGGTLQFLRDPDTGTGYSGEGYEWMMQAAAAAVGTDFDDLARQLLFDPAGMDLSSYTFTSEFIGRLAVPYSRGHGVHNVVRREPSASDDLRTTAREYAQFVLSAWEGDAIAPELRKEQLRITEFSSNVRACQPGAMADFCPRRIGWGLGWLVYEYDDRTIVHHDGGDEGEKALAYYDVTNRRGAVILTNGAQGHQVMRRLAVMLDAEESFGQFFLAE